MPTTDQPTTTGPQTFVQQNARLWLPPSHTLHATQVRQPRPDLPTYRKGRAMFLPPIVHYLLCLLFIALSVGLHVKYLSRPQGLPPEVLAWVRRLRLTYRTSLALVLGTAGLLVYVLLTIRPLDITPPQLSIMAAGLLLLTLGRLGLYAHSFGDKP